MNFNMVFFVKILIAIILAASVLAAIVFLLHSKTEPQKISKVCINNNCFNIELAETYFERTKGLMFRKNLADNSGMLFVFPNEGFHSFWMKNTLIPLDIIWINKENKIVFVSENNQPCGTFSCPSIKPTQPAKYVLEINAGISQKLGIKTGDKVSF